MFFLLVLNMRYKMSMLRNTKKTILDKNVLFLNIYCKQTWCKIYCILFFLISWNYYFFTSNLVCSCDKYLLNIFNCCYFYQTSTKLTKVVNVVIRLQNSSVVYLRIIAMSNWRLVWLIFKSYTSLVSQHQKRYLNILPAHSQRYI